MRIHPAVQGSGIWMVERARYLTASVLNDWMSPTTFALSKSDTARSLVATAAGAIVFGQVDEDQYVSPAMIRGSELEAEARAWYAMNFEPVKEVGLCIADGDICACSPDGLIGEDGGFECKAPKFKDHCANLASDTLRTKYVLQVQMCLLVTGRKWWDWVSYYRDERSDNCLPVKKIRCYPDPQIQAAILLAVAEFNKERAVLVEKFVALAE